VNCIAAHGRHELDLSRAALRSVSPFHLEIHAQHEDSSQRFFAMADGGRLTRLVSCISENTQWLSRSTRRSCELVVLQAKLQVSAAEQISRLSDSASRESIRTRLRQRMQSRAAIARRLTSASGDLLELLPGRRRSCMCGRTIPGDWRSAIRGCRAKTRWAKSRRPVLGRALGHRPPCSNRQQTLSVQLAACFVALGAPDDFVIWFRRDRLQQLRWLGIPARSLHRK